MKRALSLLKCNEKSLKTWGKNGIFIEPLKKELKNEHLIKVFIFQVDDKVKLKCVYN